MAHLVFVSSNKITTLEGKPLTKSQIVYYINFLRHNYISASTLTKTEAVSMLYISLKNPEFKWRAEIANLTFKVLSSYIFVPL